MQRVFDFGERVGLALSLVLWIAWVGGGAAAVWHSGKFLAPYLLAIAVVLLIAVITGIGGLIGYWVVADLVEFWRLGYRVKFVARSEWLKQLACTACDDRLETEVWGAHFRRPTQRLFNSSPHTPHI